jgi:hypothetical protein
MPHLFWDAVTAARPLICVFPVGVIRGGSLLSDGRVAKKRQDRNRLHRPVVSVPVLGIQKTNVDLN